MSRRTYKRLRHKFPGLQTKIAPHVVCPVGLPDSFRTENGYTLDTQPIAHAELDRSVGGVNGERACLSFVFSSRLALKVCVCWFFPFSISSIEYRYSLPIRPSFLAFANFLHFLSC